MLAHQFAEMFRTFCDFRTCPFTFCILPNSTTTCQAVYTWVKASVWHQATTLHALDVPWVKRRLTPRTGSLSSMPSERQLAVEHRRKQRRASCCQERRMETCSSNNRKIERRQRGSFSETRVSQNLRPYTLNPCLCSDRAPRLQRKMRWHFVCAQMCLEPQYLHCRSSEN